MDKKIGILTTNKGNIFGVSMPYFSYFSNFGNVMLINSLSSYIHEDLDLLVLPGGSDVNSNRYNQPPHPKTRLYNAALEYFDEFILPQYINAEVPIFGICRGMQTLNVHFGGELDQHIEVSHSTKYRGEEVDELILNEYILINTFGEEVLSNCPLKGYSVNSIHHQGIMSKIDKKGKITFPKLASCLLPAAYEANFGNLEAFVHRELPIVGVQWHPEELANPKLSTNIIKKLINV